MDLYHAVNRGVEKKNIFLDVRDYMRFIHNLFEFNDVRPASNTSRFLSSRALFDLRGRTGREPLVNVHAWCLMRNHFHLLLSENVENGISKFLMKVNVGYAKYFNEKYKRSGFLFQGKTKKILIENDSQFNYIIHYIHLNPLDYLANAENWRIRSKEGNFRTHIETTLKYLQKYRWSSYLDYCNANNFPHLLGDRLFQGDYHSSLKSYLMDAQRNDQAVASFE